MNVNYPKVGHKKSFSYADVLKNLFPWKNDRMTDIIRKLVFLAAIIVVGVSAFFVYDYFWQKYQTAQRNEALKNAYYETNTLPESETAASDNTEKEYFQLMTGAENLLALNSDTVGYVEIPDTKISFPIVQLKGDSENGNDFYLTHDFDKQENDAGAIFLDWRNAFDYVINGERAELNSDQLIIYGHNMAKDAMFGTLKLYKTNYSYYGEHPLITLNSNYEQYTYKIFAAFLSNADYKYGEVFEYYNVINFNSEDEFYAYVNDVKIRSLILNDVDVKYGDKLLALSTCDSEINEGRFVILARLVRDGEDPYEGTQNNWRNPNPLMPDEYYRWKGGSFDSSAEFVPYG